jgi:PEP-CTERM motif
MKRLAVVALSAAVISTLVASSAAEAALINFTVTAIDGTPTYVGTSLDQSTDLDFDDAFLLVAEVGPGDVSGLTSGADTVSLSPTDINYGAGTGPTTLPGSVTKSWTGDSGDTFTETLTAVDAIDRLIPDQIIVHLSGTVSDTDGLFVDTPAFLVFNATQFGGVGTATSVMFTNTAGVITPSVPEPSTWMTMALGFGALGFVGFRKRLNVCRVAAKATPTV